MRIKEALKKQSEGESKKIINSFNLEEHLL
jgi:hypothetical protein